MKLILFIIIIYFLLTFARCAFNFRILQLPKVQKYSEKETDYHISNTTSKIESLPNYLLDICPFPFIPNQSGCSVVRKFFILNSETTLTDTLLNVTSTLNETISFELKTDTVFIIDIYVERNISGRECFNIFNVQVRPELSNSLQFINLYLRFIGNGQKIDCENEQLFGLTTTSSKSMRLIQFQNLTLKSVQLFGEMLVFRNTTFEKGVVVYENDIVLWDVSGEMPIGKIAMEESRLRSILMINGIMLINSLNYLEKITSLWITNTIFQLENVFQFVNIDDLILQNVEFIPATYDKRMLISPFVTLRFIKLIAMNRVNLNGFSFKTVMSIEYSVNVLLTRCSFSNNYIDSKESNTNVVIAKGLNQLHVLYNKFHNNYSKYGSCFEITGVTSLIISTSSFSNNTVHSSPVYIARYVDTYYTYLRVQNSLFIDNFSTLKSGGISIEKLSTETNLDVDIFSCTFLNNVGELGGAVYSVSKLMVSNGIFSFNRAAQQGGAIFVIGGLSVKNSNFLNNSVSDMSVSYCTQMDCIGSGGAISFLAEIFLDSFLFLKRNTFEGNSALRGGAVSMSMPYETDIEINIFANCIAQFSGGGIYINSILNSSTTKSIITNNYFSKNEAHVYGNDMSSLVSRVSWRYIIDKKEYELNEGGIKIYPGQVFSLVPIAYDYFNDYIPELREISTVTITHSDRFQLDQEVNSFSDMYVSVINQTTEYTSQKLILQSAFSAIKSEIPLTLEPCPHDTILKPANYGKSLDFICQQKPSYDYVIAAAVTATVVTLTLILGLISISTYFCVKVIRQVNYWMRRDRAEKDIEKRLLENEITSLEDHSLQTLYSTSTKKQALPSFIISIDQIFPEKKIGEGGTGVVYLGKWHHHPVAIKCLKLDDNVNSDEIEKEASVMIKLRHPNIVQFYGVSITPHKHYLVVEYLEKGNLEKYITDMKRREISVRFSDKLKLLIDIACGMVYLHSLKIIHRDLKPANILMDANMTAKVCDFGISKIMENTVHTTTLYAGTLFYLAPELLQSSDQFDEKNKITTSVDVFSFSIIMWQLFFEDNPYINTKSPKLHLFHANNTSENVIPPKFKSSEHLTPFSVLARVLKGERPYIPWQGASTTIMIEWLQEFMPEFSEYALHHQDHVTVLVSDYIELMKACWSENYEDRPNFETILGCLMILKQHVDGNLSNDEDSIQFSYEERQDRMTDIHRILHN